jgi:hypothetical protein
MDGECEIEWLAKRKKEKKEERVFNLLPLFSPFSS